MAAHTSAQPHAQVSRLPAAEGPRGWIGGSGSLPTLGPSPWGCPIPRAPPSPQSGPRFGEVRKTEKDPEVGLARTSCHTEPPTLWAHPSHTEQPEGPGWAPWPSQDEEWEAGQEDVRGAAVPMRIILPREDSSLAPPKLHPRLQVLGEGEGVCRAPPAGSSAVQVGATGSDPQGG